MFISRPLISRNYQSFDFPSRRSGHDVLRRNRRCLSERLSRRDEENEEEEGDEEIVSFYPETPSDVEFIVEDQHLPGHRNVLSEKSAYFRALLSGGFSETSQQEITLNVPLVAFKAVLAYMYTLKMPLRKMIVEDVIDALSLADQFGLSELKTKISEHLRQQLRIDNVCGIFEEARLYVLDTLIRECFVFMDRNAEKILNEETINKMSTASLEKIIRRDPFFCLKKQLSLAIEKWCSLHGESNVERILSYLLDTSEPDNTESTAAVDVVFDPITEQQIPCHLLYRATKWLEVNMATAAFCSRTIEGESSGALFEDDPATFTWHSIADNNKCYRAIVVQLGDVCKINHIKLLLLSCEGAEGGGGVGEGRGDDNFYSYYVEVSVNQLHWDRVVDYTAYHCRSWQQLYFEARPVRYIRLVGTHNTSGNKFSVATLKALFTARMPDVNNGFVERREVISIVAKGLGIIGEQQEQQEQQDEKENSTIQKCDGFGKILVHLGQPYQMRSVKWDCNDQTCYFHVDVSPDLQNWDVVADKKWDEVDVTKTIFFQPRPIVFIRIVASSEIFQHIYLVCGLSHSEMNLSAEIKNKFSPELLFKAINL